jgi:hypothetical protein
MSELLKKGELSKQELQMQLQETVEAWKAQMRKTAEATIALGRALHATKEYCAENDLPYLKTVQEWSGLPTSTISTYTLIGERASQLLPKVDSLPPSPGALYALAKLPEEVLDKANVTPEMTIKDIKNLNPENKTKANEKEQEVKSTKVANKIVEVVSTLKIIRDNWIDLEDELSVKKINKLKLALKKTLETLEEDDGEDENVEEEFEI